MSLRVVLKGMTLVLMAMSLVVIGSGCDKKEEAPAEAEKPAPEAPAKEEEVVEIKPSKNKFDSFKV